MVKGIMFAAVKNCGIATGVINFLILYFTLPKIEFIELESLLVNFLMTAIGCGLICPFFGGLTLKSLKSRNDIFWNEKQERFISKYIPNNLIVAAFIISFITVVICWGIPYIVVVITNFSVLLARIYWICLIAIYAGIVASIATYFGILRAYYAQK